MGRLLTSNKNRVFEVACNDGSVAQIKLEYRRGSTGMKAVLVPVLEPEKLTSSCQSVGSVGKIQLHTANIENRSETGAVLH
jgi:hypothetical protein